MSLSPLVHSQTTGFLQTAAGPYDYDDAANWVSGTINGVWDSSLTVTNAQTITFDSNLTLATGLSFGYTGGQNITLRGDGTDRTITLGGDVSVTPVNNQTVSFGSATAGQNLNLNLGGNRTFTVSGAKTVQFFNTISGGDITVTGGGTFRLSRAASASSSSIRVTNSSSGNTTLNFDSSTSGVTGAVRASSVTLAKGTLSVTGNAGANSVDTITNALTIDGSKGYVAPVYVNPNASRNARLDIGSLVRENHGVVLFSGSNLGANTIASATAGTGNIQFSTAPTGLVGGNGTAGTTTISILPWAIGGTTSTDGGSTFVTYTADNGIRTLNTSTEFAASVADGATTQDNVRLTGNTTLTLETTVNSLIVAPSVTTAISGGTIKVTSGAILINPSNVNVTTTIGSNLDFGTAEGIIGASFNRAIGINGNISGSAGLTLYNVSQNAPSATTFSLNSSGNTYTGDTTILGGVYLGNANFLPSGSRAGNVNLFGTLRLNTGGGTTVINGLNGSGSLYYSNSASAIIQIGDNNASGNFTGVISDSGKLSLNKIGSGTQVLSGNNTYSLGTTVSAGTLIVNNTVGSGTGSGAVNVVSGAKLGGNGFISGAVSVNGTIAAGNSIGVLSTGNLTIGATGALDNELGRSGVTPVSDRVAVTGTVSIASGADLKLTLYAGLNNPQVGDTFFLISNDGADAITGVFTKLNGIDTTLGEGSTFSWNSQDWVITYQASFDTSSFTGGNDLAIQVVPEPATWALLAGGLTLAVALRRRRNA